MTNDNRSFHRSSHLIVNYIDRQNSNHLGKGKGLPLEVLQLEELALGRKLELALGRKPGLALDQKPELALDRKPELALDRPLEGVGPPEMACICISTRDRHIVHSMAMTSDNHSFHRNHHLIWNHIHSRN